MNGEAAAMAAYVIWKIFMKQYARLRYGTQGPPGPTLIWHSYAAIQSETETEDVEADTNIEAGRAEAEAAVSISVSGSGAGAAVGIGIGIPESSELAEISILNDTQIDVPPGAGVGGGILESPQLLTNGRDMKGARAAPIARNEEVDEVDVEVADQEADPEVAEVEQLSANANYVCCRFPTTTTATATSATSATATLNRSKSRVRSYLKKCRQRLTGQQPKTSSATTTTTTTIILVRNEPATATIEERESEEEDEDVESLGEDDEETEGSASAYTDALPIDCRLSANVEDPDQQAVVELEPEEEVPVEAETQVSELPSSSCGPCSSTSPDPVAVPRQQSVDMEVDADTDDMLARLIDSHLSHIYPVYWARTRAILIQQARERLVCGFDGCLLRFEQGFLCKFAQIAAALRSAHQIGESWLWHPGWPLATPNGALVLQLSDSEIAHALRPAELYLCIKLETSTKTEAETIPRLYAVWRSTRPQETVQSQCIDHENPRQLPLSVLQLEMTTAAAAIMAADGGELPQLLQNLLVSVERSIERVSLNELQMQLHPGQGEDLLDEANNNNNNNSCIGLGIASGINNSSNNSNSNSLVGSPKCGLRRSDLITKNKLFNNRYMLRRLTNRQDSMNSTSSGNSNVSDRSSSSSSSGGEELLTNSIEAKKRSSHGSNSTNNNNNNNEACGTSTSPALPLFCLGNSFPHIDSDEEPCDSGSMEKHQSLETCETELLLPSSIGELPEKLLTSGVYLPGTRTLQGDPLVTVDAACVASAGLNCYELATLLLCYSTIPDRSSCPTPTTPGTTATINGHKSAEQQQQQQQQQLQHQQHHLQQQHQQQQKQQPHPAQQTFTILIAIEKSQHLCVIDLICQSLRLLAKQIGNCEILAVCAEASLLQLCNEQQQQKLKNNNSDRPEPASPSSPSPPSSPSLPSASSPSPSHLVKFISVDQVTTSVAPSQLPTGLLPSVPALSELPGQRHHDAGKWREFFAQLEAFQRQCSAAGGRLVAALSDIRAADLQGLPTRRQLYGQHRALSRALMDSQLHSLRKMGAGQLFLLQELARGITTASGSPSSPRISSPASSPSATPLVVLNPDAAHKLRKVTLLFNEVDRAAQRLEQLTEQRRERLRQLTRQRALEDEISEVTSWLGSDGAENLQKFSQLHWDDESQLRAQEQEFEKYYFIAMKHLAKGRDLHAAALKVSVLSESANNLKAALDQFGHKLELAHERFESVGHLLHLLTQHQRESAGREELQRLAEQLGATALLEKHWPAMRKSHSLPAASSTPATSSGKRVSYRCSSGSSGSFEGGPSGGSCSCWRESRNLEDMDEPEEEEEEQDCDGGDGEEQQSKIADSGVGVCDNCERNPKLARICSCQSLNEKNHDELMEDECFGDRPSKRYIDMHSPMEANAHLQCHGSSLELPKLEELSCLEPKIQKTLLLIMREMIGTERDYVRSLYYVIENYIDELLREDIPQPLRGQRNVIFGNIEKIFEFHNSHFLGELERYERNPLKVGAAFLEMESKFYLYALYNKNKPKSDTLLSEYGSSFFKPKQLQLQDKLDLASYLLKPVQRMGKYALLLQQLVKACRSVEGPALQEIAADVEELQRAEEMVKFQLRHGNDLLAMDSLRDCDVNVKEQGRLLRQNEFLVWQGRGGKKTLRQVFLFEELVLFSKARRFPDHKNLDIYIYKNSIKTSDIGLTAHTGDSATKFEIWFRKRKPDDTWMLQCMSEDIKNAWTEEISKLLWKQAKRNREIRLAEMSSMGIGSKPCLDIRPSNNQISDRSIPLAQLNKTPKLRHSEPGKGSMRRPNSLISESSLSSGTSTTSGSSISGGSSSGHHDGGGGRHSLHFGKLPGPHSTGSTTCSATLELINETQTLKLGKSQSGASGSTKGSEPGGSEGGSGQGLGGSKRHHKRSTTIVSQLSMESGIVSDICVTPDQEQSAAESSRSSWSTSTTSASATSTTSASTVILRRYRSYAHAAESANPDGSGK
ncbi:uncharacterized protein LOC6493522 isoform X2 [Drosophila ananassae]|uniref:uncharacterized protein LOC6493522 isoform X2 n=1 Tax=Drosophila ananassae TaxID=7217 RepID=UPI0013A5D5B6|nr:uncharacterized protein LOC6493522 isoform X2 [Drosophila ananassae]